LAINFRNLNSIELNLKKSSLTKLLIVTKNRNFYDIQELVKKGYKRFGENKVQEAKIKFSDTFREDNEIELHMIGPLQTNKVKDALKIFHTIQSVDRINLAEKIAKELSKNDNVLTKNFYIQVNIGEESQKSGIPINELHSFYEFCININLNVTGLMCIPPNLKNPSAYFSKMRELKKNLNNDLLLSMGMSEDYEFAVDNGSNLVRIGSRIFV
tara:strand:+ start:556 stop:1194 length:639 start_codon:yes stop_codon:yes gene_type:complete